MNPIEITQLNAVIEHGWPGAFTAEAQEVYLEALQDLPFEAAKVAVKKLLMTEEFRPSIAEIRREVAKSLNLLPPTIEIAQVQAAAWMAYREDMACVNGSGFQPVRPDVHPAVIRACGSINSTGHESWQATFRRAYLELSEKATNYVLATDMSARLALGTGN